MALLSSVRRAACAAALAALAAGCEFIHPPTYVDGDPEQLLVHAVLTAGSDSAAVLVTRVGTGFGAAPIAGALVRVIGPGGQTVLAEAAELAPCSADYVPIERTEGPSGCYAAALAGGVTPGAEYRLEVDLSTGERVRGRTTVPAAPVPHSPPERVRVAVRPESWYMVAVAPFTIRWDSEFRVGLNAWASQVWVPSGPEQRCGISMHRPENTAVDFEADSLVVFMDVMGCGDVPDGLGTPSSSPGGQIVRPDSIEVTLALTAYDPVYATYVRFGEHGVPEKQARGGLEGAYGVFGSAARSTRRVILVPQD